MSTVVVIKGVIATNLLHGDHTTRWISEGNFVAAICRSHDIDAYAQGLGKNGCVADIALIQWILGGQYKC